MENQALFPNPDEDGEEPGRITAEHSAGRCTEEIITFAIYPLFLILPDSSFHYIANSFGHSSTTSYVYSVGLLKINEVNALLVSKGHFP